MKTIKLTCLLLCIVAFASAQINLPGKIKDKINQKVDQKTDEAIDETLDDSKEKKKKESRKTENESSGEESSEPAASSSDNTSVKSYSKFDFVPGNKVVYYEDFTPDAIGDFPSRWNTNSSGEIVTLDKFPGKWLQMTGNAIYVPEFKTVMPDNFTFEFDMVVPKTESVGTFQFAFSEDPALSLSDNPFTGKAGFYVYFRGTDWEIEGWKEGASERIMGTSEKKALNKNLDKKVHYAFWVQKQRVRLYIDEEKVFDLPRAITPGTKFNHMRFLTWLNEGSVMLVSNIRVAEATADMRSKLLTEGKLTTNAITFDVNSDKIKPESYGVIREIANVMKENADLRLKITGHTDSDGKPETNLDLSKRRATAIKKLLETEYAIDGSRMETDGKGSTQAMVPNTSAENKASNRRVEFVKL
jgi:outer membrane protein OmpA-like peptidoglycan-associated protein